jgi:hypothetical protein
MTERLPPTEADPRRAPRAAPTAERRLQRRLRRLSPAARRALRRAALLPQPFSLAALGARGPEAEEAMLTLFQEAVDLGLPVAEGPGEQLELSPMLVAALSDGLLPSLRLRLKHSLHADVISTGSQPAASPAASPTASPAVGLGRLDGAALMGAPTLPAPPPGALDGAALAEAPEPLPWPGDLGAAWLQNNAAED